MRIAIIYDWINTFGGAERILLTLYNLYPTAYFFTSVCHKKKAPWARIFKIKTSFLQKIPFASSYHQLFPFLMPIAFESFDFSNFDLVISVTSAFAKGVITKPNTLHVCYLLTPTRYLWSHEDFYFQNKIVKLISSPFVSYLKKWDNLAKDRPDYLISISKTVQERTGKFYKRGSDVIYPPVSINKFIPHKKNNKGNYFLTVGRLVPYKRIDLVIRAFNKLKLPLIIIGSGRSEYFLRTIAGSTIFFLKNLTDHELISYYQNCRALILPSEEDFGIVSVEAQASGKPVIAFGKGGALETIKEGITGIFFEEQTVQSLISAIKKFEKMSFSSRKCLENSRQFSEESFKIKFKKKIQKYLANK